MSITSKLVNIQTTLKAPKGQFNNFGKYKYRSCEDILEAVKPLLKENELVLLLTDTIEAIDGRHYIHATVRLTDGEQEIITSAYARESLTKKGMDDSQITGTASSYARKYALAGLFLLDDTKDADTMDNSEPKAKGEYPDAEFQKNKEAWGKLIESDKYTVTDIVGKIEAKGYKISAYHKSQLEGFVRG